ncbi:metalloregulator ArsR/SmtB family transcription factor [Fictibacillus sp. CENA-BCM004]|uniref:Metalloregulator ArsR/SmtB family transcription factor n=2 Tax=Fictibacillus terranigra TaxID=3058424 RepID=A0ABT8E8M0_9BACL|nr:metalloregulator ArsR/SmtB family transcription factor [Fictibacillus sp. CENA-BCM004]MDN4074225.1 metalloregulator ArsR/SmtB family transcription factor [Fictibacillus sp. CENA-BCM004]
MMNTAKKHDVFQAIADPTRREILKMLAGKELAITEITVRFPMSRTAVSKHLLILSEAGLVKNRKSGREKLYTLQAEPLSELDQWLSYFDQFWQNKISVLKHLVENEGQNS